MICQVLYYTDDSKALKSKGFSDVEKAKIWMDENEGSKQYILNSRIVVDYSAIEAFQEMYELMKEQVFGTNKKLIEKKMI